MYVVQGADASNLNNCWKVKIDPATDRRFFVHASGALGKRWHLPDLLYEGKFMKPEAKRPTPEAKLMTQQLTPPVHVPNGKPKHEEPLISPPVIATLHPANSLTEVFAYNDPEWRDVDEQRELAAMREARRRAFSQQVTDEHNRIVAWAQSAKPPTARPPSPTAATRDSPTRLEAAAVSLQQLALKREASLQEARNRLREHREAVHTAEHAALAEIEALHHRATELLSSPHQDEGSRPAVAATKGRRHTGTAVDVDFEETDRRGIVATLRQLLEDERARSAKLQALVDEYERLALERAIDDAERERKEILLRVKMVESIAAHRQQRHSSRSASHDTPVHIPPHPLPEDEWG